MMSDIRIDGRLQRVFVLTQTDERILYIPLKSLHRVDYEQLTKISKEFGNGMLEGMRKTTLNNGRNALTQYDQMIQVSIIQKRTPKETTGKRIKKPEEVMVEVARSNPPEPEKTVETPRPTPTPAPRKKSGPKPKTQ